MKIWRPLLKHLGPALSPLPSSRFDSANGERALKAALSASLSLDGLGNFSRAELSAAGALDRLSGPDAEGQACAPGARWRG